MKIMEYDCKSITAAIQNIHQQWSCSKLSCKSLRHSNPIFIHFSLLGIIPSHQCNSYYLLDDNLIWFFNKLTSLKKQKLINTHILNDNLRINIIKLQECLIWKFFFSVLVIKVLRVENIFKKSYFGIVLCSSFLFTFASFYFFPKKRCIISSLGYDKIESKIWYCSH